MNKKNFPIFISLFIVSLFFTVIFYYGYTSLRANYGYYMASNFSHAEIKDKLNNEDVEKLKSIKEIDLVGKISLNPDNAKFNDDLIVINYQDEDINKMKEFSRLKKGRFAQKEDEIVLSQSLVDKNKFKLGDKVELDIGKRKLNGEKIGPTSPNTDREEFEKTSSQKFILVGIYGDVYNKYSKLNYGLSIKDDMKLFRSFIKFNSFEDSYKNKDKIESKINKILDKDIHLEFSEELINYYGVENDSMQNIMSQAIIVLSVFFCIVIFVFFIKNIFWVWGIRKLRELSIYKSIGSTNGQIYIMLLKEGLSIGLIPILLGHITGFVFMKYLYRNIQSKEGVSAFEIIKFNPILSLTIILISFVIVAFAIRTPAKKISKINIIDGIKGNINLSKSRKKKSKNTWKELRLNNLSSIKSQRYISAIGILIISVFIMIIGISTYYRDFSYYDDGYNFTVDYFTLDEKVPEVLKKVEEKIPNKKSYIFSKKYVQVVNNQNFSKEAKKAGLSKEAKKNIEKYKSKGMDGYIIALEDQEIKNIGGNKGEFTVYNLIQKDSSIPISKAEKIPYFENPQSFDIIFENDYEETIKISNTIKDLGEYKSKTRPFDVKIYTDYDTYFKLINEADDENNKQNLYTLKMKINDSNTKDLKDYVESIIRTEISSDERFNITTAEEVKKNQYNDLTILIKVITAMALIILILNITNGYSSINLSLMSRKREIGSLYSCGMDTNELKSLYQKEFVKEQVISLIISIIISLGIMFIISVIAPDLKFINILKYYNYKVFLAFSFLVYGINYLIYHYSLKRILDRPIIDLIKTI